MKLNVTVTQEDIDLGGHKCSWCPVHRAISRAMGPHHTLVVNSEWVNINDLSIDFPERVQDWISDYDGGGKVGPIGFELEVP